MSANQVYGKSDESTSRNGSQRGRLPEYFPDDPLFRYLASKRKVSYEPLVADAIRHSEAPKRLTDRYTEAATLLFSNLLYWTPKSTHAGWIYKSRDEFWEETRLPRRRQDRARELLREAGIVDERSKQGRLYYRIRWGTLKPLLRLALEGSGEMDPGSPCDPGQVGSLGDPGALAHHAIQGAGSPCDPASVFDTDREIQASSSDQSSSARASANGVREAGSQPEMDDENGSPSREEPRKGRSTTPPYRPEAPGRADEKGWKPKPSLKRSTQGYETLGEGIIRTARELPAEDLSAAARAIGRLLSQDLGTPDAPEGLAVRTSEVCIRRGRVEQLGIVAAKASQDVVRFPEAFLRTYLANQIKEAEGENAPPGEGGPVERFKASREAARSRLIAAKMSNGKSRGGKDSATRDNDGRRSLAASAATPVYGVRDTALERDPESYFKRGGSKARGSR